MPLVVGIPPAILNLVQQGVLERTFHDGLFPKLQYRAEALYEEWEANTGTEMFMSRPGLLTPAIDPLVAGTDPIPQDVAWEQWSAVLNRYGSTVDTHMPTSVVSNANMFLRKVHQLGLQAGQSVNQLARNALHKAYLSGQTTLKAACINTDTQIQVSSLNGFTDVIIVGINVRPEAISPSRPLPIRISTGATMITRNAIAFAPDDPNDRFGPGTLQLDAAIGGAGFAARTPVVSIYAPRIVRAGGGASVDAITGSDAFSFQLIVNAVSYLKSKNVPTHADGYYHCHLSPMSQAQIYTDAAWQRLHMGLPENIRYKEGFLGTLMGTVFFENNEAAGPTNSGARVSTGTNAFYSKGIGAETTNNSGLDIGRVIITGRGSIYEKTLDETKYISEAGVMGKIGEFDLVQNGIQVATERLRLILRAPMDRLQDMVSSSWSISTDFPVPSDITAGGYERYRRAVVIEHSA